MRLLLLIPLLLLPFIQIKAQRISDRQMARQITRIKAFQKGNVAIALNKIKTSKAVVSYNEDSYMTPASNVKLLTFLGAIQNFDALPNLEFFKETDSITHFRSTGYPLLLHPLYEDLGLTGYLKQQQQLVYHPTEKVMERFGAGWSWDDYNYYFAAETSRFPIYGNVIQLETTTSSQTVQVHPTYFIKHLKKNTLKNAPKIKRLEHTNQFRINPKKWATPQTRYTPFRTGDSLFINLLSDAIQRPVRFASSDEQPPVWKTLYAQQSDSLYHALLRDSDNLVAESLLLMIAKKRTDTLAAKKAIDLLQSDWKAFLPDPLIWVDGSGVSRYNMLTPRSLVAVLEQIHQQIGMEEIKKFFPSTTLNGIEKDPWGSDQPYVFAKTGTLRHNLTLSGYLLGRKNTPYAFSIMVNHVSAPNAEVRKGIGSLLAYLRKKL